MDILSLNFFSMALVGFHLRIVYLFSMLLQVYNGLADRCGITQLAKKLNQVDLLWHYFIHISFIRFCLVFFSICFSIVDLVCMVSYVFLIGKYFFWSPLGLELGTFHISTLTFCHLNRAFRACMVPYVCRDTSHFLSFLPLICFI